MEFWSKLLMAGFVILLIILGSQSEKNIPETSLPVYNAKTASIVGKQIVGGQCEADKCLTVYVAPWCPACKRAKPMINNLVSELESEGVKVSVVIGYDSLGKIKQYANQHPYPVLLDPDKDFYRSARVGGVPYFVVTDWHGEILQEVRGAYPNVGSMRQKLGI